MNLDFLDVLSQPAQENVGTMGTLGASSIDAGFRVPTGIAAIGNNGEPSSFLRRCHPNVLTLPPRSQSPGTGKSMFSSPLFPLFPLFSTKKEQVCAKLDIRAEVQVAGWIAARCTRPCDPRKVWAARDRCTGITKPGANSAANAMFARTVLQDSRCLVPARDRRLAGTLPGSRLGREQGRGHQATAWMIVVDERESNSPATLRGFSRCENCV